MASSIVSGSTTSNTPRGYSIEPMERKPEKPPNVYLEEDTKVVFSCQNGSLLLKVSSLLMALSFVLQVIAVGAPYWAAGWRRDKMSWHEGVWMSCYTTELDNKWICSSYDYSSATPGVPGWYTFCQAMGLISLVVFLPALMLNVFYTMHPKGKMFRGLLWFNFVFTFITGLLPLLMVMVFGIGHPKEDRFPIPYRDEDYDDAPFRFHASFVLEIFAILISFGAFGLEIFDYIRNDYSE